MWAFLLKQIIRQWKSNAWILAELFLSFICLWTVAYFLIALLSRCSTKTGFDIEQVYAVTCSVKPEDAADYDAQSDWKQEMQTLTERIRRYPGVEAVGLMDNYCSPYTPSASMSTVYKDTCSYKAVLNGMMSPDIVQVFRFTPVDRRTEVKKEAENGDVFLVSERQMETMFGKEATRGKFRWKKDQDDKLPAIKIEGNVARNEYIDREEPFIWTVMQNEARYLKKCNGNASIYFRVSPGADNGFLDRFWKDMKGQLEIGNTMICNIVPMSTVRRQMLQMLGINLYYTFAYFLAAFFLLCTFLGIIGTFWFRTEARVSEIGLRMALGSTRRQVRRQMVSEGLLLFALVWVPGMFIVYHFRDVANVFDAPLPISGGVYFLLTSLVVTLFMVLLIIAGIGYPARQASRVNPVDALRDE